MRKIHEIDTDTAFYVGSCAEGVFYDAIKDGRYWCAVAAVDTKDFTSKILDDCGFANRQIAVEAAENAAVEWCEINGVSFDKKALVYCKGR